MEVSHHYDVYVKHLKGSSGSDTTVYDDEAQCNSLKMMEFKYYETLMKSE